MIVRVTYDIESNRAMVPIEITSDINNPAMIRKINLEGGRCFVIRNPLKTTKFYGSILQAQSQMTMGIS